MFRNTPQPLDVAKAVYSVALWAVFFWVSLATAYAGQVTLTWDASPGPDLKGYRLYYGLTSGKTSGQFTSAWMWALGIRPRRMDCLYR